MKRYICDAFTNWASLAETRSEALPSLANVDLNLSDEKIVALLLEFDHDVDISSKLEVAGNLSEPV